MVKEDIILSRSEQGLCPFCKKLIGTDFKVIEYKDKKIWVCKKHSTSE